MIARREIRPPDVEPRATDHINEMITMITTLIEKAMPMKRTGMCCSMSAVWMIMALCHTV